MSSYTVLLVGLLNTTLMLSVLETLHYQELAAQHLLQEVKKQYAVQGLKQLALVISKSREEPWRYELEYDHVPATISCAGGTLVIRYGSSELSYSSGE